MKARGITVMMARQAAELRAKGEALIREADNLDCQSWNERMWAHVSERRADRSLANRRPGRQPRLSVAADRMLRLQDAEGHRPGGAVAVREMRERR